MSDRPKPSVYGDGSMLFYENYDQSREKGDLIMIDNGGDKTKIAEGVRSYHYGGKGIVYVLCDYRGEAGELYLWKGDHLEFLDNEVSAILKADGHGRRN